MDAGPAAHIPRTSRYCAVRRVYGSPREPGGGPRASADAQPHRTSRHVRRPAAVHQGGLLGAVFERVLNPTKKRTTWTKQATGLKQNRTRSARALVNGLGR